MKTLKLNCQRFFEFFNPHSCSHDLVISLAMLPYMLTPYLLSLFAGHVKSECEKVTVAQIKIDAKHEEQLPE